MEVEELIANLGYLALVLTFLVAIYGAAAAIYGARRNRSAWVESARHAMLLTFPLLSLSTMSIVVLLVSGNYEIRYVASVVSDSMPTYLKVTALWGGQAGSLLFWSWLLSAFSLAVSLRQWERDREFLPWVTLITLGTLAFFVGLVAFFENPFARLWQTAGGEQVAAMIRPAGALPLVPSDGQGLNPLLRHPGMVIHPPMLYLGFVSFVVPYAYAMAALITGRGDDRWIRLTRRWTLAAWLFLSLGLILGGRWAYDVLGWGGYWGWDPVEIAAFMPWLAGTAFLHSVVIQEKRGMLKHWNMVLIILTYALVIFGTFLTRSGVLTSVHAFASSAIGPVFFAYIALSFVASLALLIHRWGKLSGENHLDSLLSREALFLFNNLIFLLILVVCFLGVIFPLVSEIFTGEKVTVGPTWYERITGPFWMLLLLLMALAPLSVYGRTAWKRLGAAIWKPLAISLVIPAVLLGRGVRLPGALIGYWLIAVMVLVTVYEFWRGALARRSRHGENFLQALWRLAGRNRRRYGGYVIHLGVALMAIGIFGIEMFQSETQGTLASGEQMTLGSYTVVYENLEQYDLPEGINVADATLSLYDNGKYVGELHPRKEFYYDSQQPVTIPAIRSTMQDDVYVLLVGWEPVGLGGATFKMYHNPLVNFVWLGGVVFILGTLVAAWPDREPAERERARSAVGASRALV